MRKLTLFLTIAFVLTCVSGLLAQTGVVSVDNVTNLAPGDNTKLRAGNDHVVSIKFDFTGMSQKWSTLNAFEVYSPDGANWVNLVATNGPLTDAVTPALPAGPLRIFKYYTSANAGVSYTATAQIPYEVDEFGDPITNPTLFEQPGPNPTAGTDPNLSRVAYSHAMIGLGGDGFQGGTNGIAILLRFSTLLADAGKTMCLDTVKGAGTVAWNWAKPSVPAGVSPRWDCNPWTADDQVTPLCFEIFEVPNIPPNWCAPAGSVEFNHCGQGSFNLCADDGGDGPGPVTFDFAPAFDDGTFGEIDGNHWTWSGTTVPQSGMITIEFVANDGADNSMTNFQLHVTTTNTDPTISCVASKTIGMDKTDSLKFTAADDDDCDLPLTITAVPTDPGVTGPYFISGSYLVYTPNAGDAALTQPIHFTITANDGEVDVSCGMDFNVIVGAPYQIEIEKKKDQPQGIFTDVAIKLYGVDPNEGLGGFDLLVAYDASALAFQLAYEGDIYNQDDDAVLPGCGWEYFTYRFGPYGNCGNACPSGMLRVIGMAETNNGPYHPDCLTTPYYPEVFPVTLAYLRFLVSNDRTLECSFVPIRFFWYNCGDNTLSNADGSKLFLSDAIYDFTAYGSAFIGTSIAATEGVIFPTYQGAQEECICNPQIDPTCKIAALRYVDFQNGGVDIVCADSIDARGDINMNGLGYEIADAVMFTNYFIEGIGAFGTHIEGSIAASDTNADGLALTVADLVYLIRVVIGDAVPYDKAIPVAANVTFGDGVFNIDAEMGAAHIVMAGEVIPELLATNMEMKYGVVDGNMNILVYSLEANQSFSGDFLRVEGRMISAQFATFLGQPVNADVMPANFAVHQNYPNPFNPTTTIKVEFPKAGLNWTLNIYNVTGQLVETMSGKSTGYDEIVWDASKNASGIYFYKVTAGDYSATKKAILLK